jgi:hypothetical protein
MKENDSIFGDVIYSYSRAQAISDGLLIDLNLWSVTRQHWKYPTCCTSTVWSIIDAASKLQGKGYDHTGILHDIYTMAKRSIGKTTTDRIYFQVLIAGKLHDMYIHIGPGDTTAPVLTLMKVGED